MGFDLSYLVQQIPALIEGLRLTLELSLLSIFLSIVVGVIGAIILAINVPVAAQLVSAYVSVIRQTPLLAQIFFIFYGLPEIGIRLSLFWSGVVTLVIWAGAYQIENIRGGLLTVTTRQREAALALGLSNWDFIRLISMSLALRASVPSMLNTSVSLLKNSAFLQAVGVAELTYVAIDRISMDFRTLEMLVVLGVVYLILVLTLAYAASKFEAYLRKPFQV